MQVGGDIESICGKCGATWHLVIALVKGQIARVECKQCGARHRYRGVAAATSAAPRRASATRTPSTRARSSKQPPIVEADLSRPMRSFRVSDTYWVGDRVAHANFGEGVVQAVRGVTKIEILFDTGRKTLVHGRGNTS